MEAEVLDVYYRAPYLRKPSKKKGYHHDTNYPKLTTLVNVNGDIKPVFVGPDIALVLGKKRLSEKARNLIIKNKPKVIDVLPNEDSSGRIYYEITEESARLWAEKIVSFLI